MYCILYPNEQHPRHKLPSAQLHSFPLASFSINHTVPAMLWNTEAAVIWRHRTDLLMKYWRGAPFLRRPPWGGKSYYDLKFGVVFPKYVRGYQLLWAERTNCRLKDSLRVWCSPSIEAQPGSLNVGACKSDNAKCTFHCAFPAYSGKKRKTEYKKSPLTTASEHHRFNGLSSAVIYDGRPPKARDRKPGV